MAKSHETGSRYSTAPKNCLQHMPNLYKATHQINSSIASGDINWNEIQYTIFGWYLPHEAKSSKKQLWSSF